MNKRAGALRASVLFSYFFIVAEGMRNKIYRPCQPINSIRGVINIQQTLVGRTPFDAYYQAQFFFAHATPRFQLVE
ncbi:hypothetical protein WJ07_08425 [Burkholderia vietnamiensis]|nr:hypothetical protein WJ07_08425 [Burkholderia vietnamiensis]